MPSLPLAAGIDQGDIAKILIFGVAIVIWLLNALATWMAKQKEEENRRRVREALDKAPKPPPQRAEPQRPMRQRPEARRPLPPKLPPMPSPVVRDTRPQRKPKLVPQPIEPIEVRPRQSVVAAPSVAPAPAVASPKAGAATAASIRAWLRPATLRQQFILTELLQPPVAVRESHLER